MDELELKKLKKEVEFDLCMDRQKLITSYPFFGSIAMRLNLIPVRDVRCPTACTDGMNIYMDIAFYQSLSDEQRLFVIAHEVMHVVLAHMLRLQKRDGFVFNIATDMEVNAILLDEHFTLLPDVIIPDAKLKGKSAEEIYEILIKEQKKNQNSNGGSKNGNSGVGGCGGSGQSSKNSNSNGKQQSNNTNKGKQFDKHIYRTQEDDKEEQGITVTDKYGEVGFDKDFSPSISRDLAEKIREHIVSATQMTKRSKGRVPSSLSNYIDKLLTPEISWKELLTQFITSRYGGSRRWLPPSRRHCYRKLYLESRRSDTINIVVAIDTSGSTSNDIEKFLSEIVGLVDSFGNYTMTIIQCDCAIQKVDQFDDGNPFPKDNISSYTINGFGGSSTIPVFDYIEKNMDRIDCLVYFTDGYIDCPTNIPPYEVLWILTKDCCSTFTSFGKKVVFKN